MIYVIVKLNVYFIAADKKLSPREDILLFTYLLAYENIDKDKESSNQ